jgi:hypothetical protein
LDAAVVRRVATEFVAAGRAGPRRAPVSDAPVPDAGDAESELSAQATPDAKAAPMPSATASAPIRPTCAADLVEFINMLLLGG